jgi:acetolactate synthase-1/2/3 large subunit
MEPLDDAAWLEWSADLRGIYERSRLPGPCPGSLDLGRAVAELSDRVPDDILVTSDGGNFAGWLNRFFQFSTFRSLLGPANGAMGYGVPAAITAKLVHPERPVLCFAGDGGFMMSASELATAVQFQLGFVVLVFNNAMYGTIRMYQEKTYPGRYPGTRLVNPDFAAFAHSFGAEGKVVTRTDEFVPTVLEALRGNRLTVIDVCYDPEAITTRTTLTALREASERAIPSAKATR